MNVTSKIRTCRRAIVAGWMLAVIFGMCGISTTLADDIYLPVITKSDLSTGPLIGPVLTNSADYPGGTIPRYEKLELTFDVETIAENPQFFYDSDPPSGLEAGTGITVDAYFTPDDWQTVYTQPAFYYQEFEHETKSGKEWIYPTETFRWDVRFAPNQTGTWQYKIVAQDAGGVTETEPESVAVTASENKGFVRVSQSDPRYFEFEDGSLFLGLGYNLTYGRLDWDDPVLNNADQLHELNGYGLQLFRTWFSHWGIFTSAWGAWNSPIPERHGRYIPFPSLRVDEATYPGHDAAMVLNWNYSPGMFLGFMKRAPAVKQNTTYQLRVRYKIPKELSGPRIDGYPYGLVVKTGGWLTGPGSWPDNIYGFTDPGTGTPDTDHVYESPVDNSGTAQWAVLEHELNSGSKDFLSNLYLVLENVSSPASSEFGNVAYIDVVELREKQDDGTFGPNIISKSLMGQHLYFDQRNSYAFDKALELAEENDIYLKLVLLEKNEFILNHIDDDGQPIPENSACNDDDPDNDPAACPGNRWFYGDHQKMTKVRWLQQAWWRYVQARWGYSTSIHSWELLNEGDPWNGRHHALANELGRYMRQFEPNHHLVTTSFWHSFPDDEFWANEAYPYIDYADIHSYATSAEDTAGNSIDLSNKHGAFQPQGANKPIIRGETGFSDSVLDDTAGVWLHNFIWAGLNAGGMYEQYWYGSEHIEQTKTDNDLRYHYVPYLNFVHDIPLNNGNYQAIQAASSNPDVRIVGQQDSVEGCAHVWLQNKHHTWKNITDGVSIPTLSAVVTLSGFEPGQTYTVEQWDSYQSAPAQQIVQSESRTASSEGAIVIDVSGLDTDTSYKIISGSGLCSVD